MKNLVKKKWIKSKKLKVEYNGNSIYVVNNTATHKFLIHPYLHKHKNGTNINFDFKGESINGNAPRVKILNRKAEVKLEIPLNTVGTADFELLKYFFVIIYVPAHSEVRIKKLDIEFNAISKEKELLEEFHNEVLLITPNYPTEDNKYNTAFVHTRVEAYKKSNLNVDVLVVNSLNGKYKYNFNGIDVVKADFFFLRSLLKKKKYRKILVHFFDDSYGNVFDSVDLTNTELYFYIHGAEILYKDKHKYASKYFTNNKKPNLNSDYNIKDWYFKKYNNMSNVEWVFVSDFVKNRAEELLDIKFNNYSIIPCYVNDDIFKFQKKDIELRKKIFVLRKFSNDSCYAIDIDVRTILELSRRDFFNDLEFDIYGDGEMFDILTAPLLQFQNVHLHRKFLTHKEIAKVHKEHGIGLFASRFDTQGVSLCEAAASGCAIVTSNIPVITSYINRNLGTVCDVEEYEQYADVIEKMYYNPEFFLKVSSEVSKSVTDKFGYNNTIKKDLDLVTTKSELPTVAFSKINKDPVLSVIVPAYNVQDYLWETVMSMLNQKNAHKLEILIVNDGSKDNTAKIGENLQKKSTFENRSIVKIINKENGGHGSTINTGIHKAKGKYLKIVDGDDTLDSQNFEKLIDILENEDADIVLNDYIEDKAKDNQYKHKYLYDFMLPGKKYFFEDLCYEGYGFYKWGPILACSTYRTEMLKKANFKLTEKCFYVDMELNTNISINCQTISYHPLSIYRYFLGRVDQSITKNSYMNRYKDHEKVTFKMMDLISNQKLSKTRRDYIVNCLVLSMIKTQYIVTIEFYNKGKPFREFERRFKKYPEFYYNPKIATRAVKFHRRTNGYFIRFNSLIVKIKKMLLSKI